MIRHMLIRGLEVVEDIALGLQEVLQAELQEGHVEIGPLVIMTRAEVQREMRVIFELGQAAASAPAPRRRSHLSVV